MIGEELRAALRLDGRPGMSSAARLERILEYLVDAGFTLLARFDHADLRLRRIGMRRLMCDPRRRADTHDLATG